MLGVVVRIRRPVNAVVSYVVCLYGTRGYSWSKCYLWHKWWRLEATFLTLNILKTKWWFIVMKLSMMSCVRMSWGVLQIWELENDGTNWSIVIKVASVHIVHGLQAYWIGLVQHLSEVVWMRCWSHVDRTVRSSQLFSTTVLNHSICMMVSCIHVDRQSVMEDYHREQCQFTAKGHSWAVWWWWWYLMLSPVVMTLFIAKVGLDG